MTKQPNRTTLENRLARYGASLHRRTPQTWTTLEDGTVAPWMIQWGTVQIGCRTLAGVEAYLDRYEGIY
ncbi:hypothetical protein ABEV34_28710 [Methylorubrum rhodesianum]|uniref:hypothetical protein n=1 Tax=Methylorubrum rhodesianum TaxID=29427 RepID=UPI003D287A87